MKIRMYPAAYGAPNGARAGAAVRDHGERRKETFLQTVFAVLTIKIVGDRVTACKTSQ
jgi:hypothetical protein